MGMVILIVVLILILCFIVASSPQYLSMNEGKGSVHYCDGNKCIKSCGSDVLMILIGLAAVGVILAVLALVNAVFHYQSVTAWLWFISAVLFTTGMFFWYHFSIPEDDAEGEETQQILAASDEVTV